MAGVRSQSGFRGVKRPEAPLRPLTEEELKILKILVSPESENLSVDEIAELHGLDTDFIWQCVSDPMFTTHLVAACMTQVYLKLAPAVRAVVGHGVRGSVKHADLMVKWATAMQPKFVTLKKESSKDAGSERLAAALDDILPGRRSKKVASGSRRSKEKS